MGEKSIVPSGVQKSCEGGGVNRVQLISGGDRHASGRKS